MRKLCTLNQAAKLSLSQKILQGDGLTLLDARDLFDGLLEIRPGMSKYLGTSSSQHPALTAVRSGSGQGDCGKIGFLTAKEAADLEPFRFMDGDRDNSGAVRSAESEGFADRFLKQRKTVAETPRYKLLSVIPPTSNTVERLFSVARAVLRHEWHRLTPMTLEMILFLKVNGSFWNVATVDTCL
ncbi:Hypothetical protein PHPALM_20172 [Phytophthora palmivora]|uniref:HAT C-terminal dimerisation domain-containing protein n=1 Tax=Phytophthora palmivora TaxID=4796 RepID=A0A2P4XFJ8_9STRA|nr:Hypothetical protein PHPALM_20172 [Phytophthora palmivora]